MMGVAVFGFFFSLLFTQTHYIALWWEITNAIFISGAGAAIIGGLYWRRGTTPAAWTAVIVGAIMALGGCVRQYSVPWFPFNGTQVAFVTMIASTLSYVLVSLLGPPSTVNLDKLLHRGSLRVNPPGEITEATKPAVRVICPSPARLQ